MGLWWGPGGLRTRGHGGSGPGVPSAAEELAGAGPGMQRQGHRPQQRCSHQKLQSLEVGTRGDHALLPGTPDYAHRSEGCPWDIEAPPPPASSLKTGGPAGAVQGTGGPITTARGLGHRVLQHLHPGAATKGQTESTPGPERSSHAGQGHGRSPREGGAARLRTGRGPCPRPPRCRSGAPASRLCCSSRSAAGAPPSCGPCASSSTRWPPPAGRCCAP